MKITNIFSILIIIASFLIATIFYDSMPEQMESHWNSEGIVDGYITKFWGLYLMPFIAIIIYTIFLIIPKIDPLGDNIKKFRSSFENFKLLILLFLFYIYLLSIYWNLGNRFDMDLMILPALSILFFYIGILLSHAKRNWFIGIRTPWTLSSDKVWDKTHKLAGKLFKILSVITFVGIFIGDNAFNFVIISFITFVIFLIIYSYVEYGDEVM